MKNLVLPQLTHFAYIIGMVRLRMLNLFPDFDDATAAEPPPIIMPRLSSFSAMLGEISFEIRYLIDALLSHGTVSLPEVEEMLQRLSRFSSSHRVMILEGLFAWTRRGNITADIKGLLDYVSRMQAYLNTRDLLSNVNPQSPRSASSDH
jgi:hypothetical protein